MSYLNLSILGSTGSIGTNTLSVCSMFPKRFKIKVLAAGRNVNLLAQQIIKYKPELVVVLGSEEAQKLKLLLPADVLKTLKIAVGSKGYVKAATFDSVDLVVLALVGAVGLEATWEAVKAGKKIALANKEALVLGGELIIPLAQEKSVEILPIDSEHSAIFQVLQGVKAKEEINKLILTASGGPFLGYNKKQLEKVTVNETLNHPRWKMGPKISCDSATLMNKGLEIIEAHHLFQIPFEKIDVLVHPQSIVHSIVEYVDGCQISQMGITDMRLPIAYALNYPKRLPLGLSFREEETGPFLDLVEKSPLTFEKVDEKNFPALNLAKEAGRIGQSAPTILNGANEEALKAFLAGEISFLNIVEVVAETLNKIEVKPINTLNDIWEADKKARKISQAYISSLN